MDQNAEQVVNLLIQRKWHISFAESCTGGLAAAALAFTISTIINYILSMTFVFKGREGRDKKEEFIVFAILNLIGLGLTTLLMWLLVDKAGLYYMFAKVFTSATVMFWSFFSRKIFLEQR